jgi:hypothetical protein
MIRAYTLYIFMVSSVWLCIGARINTESLEGIQLYMLRCFLLCRWEATDGPIRPPVQRDKDARQHLRHLPDQGLLL